MICSEISNTFGIKKDIWSSIHGLMLILSISSKQLILKSAKELKGAIHNFLLYRGLKTPISEQ